MRDDAAEFVEHFLRAMHDDVSLVRPAFYDDPTNGGCRSERRVTTTAYVERSTNRITLLRLSMSPDGKDVRKRERRDVLRPAGVIKVLSVIIRYPQTVGDEGLTHWEAAQHQINRDHATFAESRGLDQPLVVFENANVVVEPDPHVLTPRNPASVRAAAERKGQSTSDYNIIIAIDINPAESVGGYASAEDRAVYVGNSSSWKSPLGLEQWKKVAATAYHHELAHHWGWEHDWSPTCGRIRRPFDPFVSAPVLFGWEDVDGDGVVEILDDTPYGISSTRRSGARQ